MKRILILISGVAILLAACTSNGGNSGKTENKVDLTASVKTEFKVGMHCTDCEQTIKKSVGKLGGIAAVEASFKDSTVVVTFDSLKVKEPAIIAAISDAGYKVDTFSRK